jgi:glycosyltransferase involved in cell wall biosynthesis
MRILYPYNEILPKRSAHDVYIVRNCAGLAAAGAEVTLAFGMGSLPDRELESHYHVTANENLSWKRLPIIRRNFGLPVNMSTVFFWATQKLIQKSKPDWVALSVFKQGAFHLKRRLPGVKYVYEVHELAWYPGRDAHEPKLRKRLAEERIMLSRADVVTVTTCALQDILRAEPYNLTLPIEVVPLAVDFAPLPPPPPCTGDLQLMYVGQMYPGQGVDLLLRALAQTKGIRLTLAGGKADELTVLKQLARSLGIGHRVQFAGFLAPAELPELVAGAHALVAPFSATGRMPYVAHTKLLEYAAWQRPVVAPDLPVTREHFESVGGWVPFVADDVDSLAGAVNSLMAGDVRQNLYESSRRHRVMGWGERSRRYLDLLRGM